MPRSGSLQRMYMVRLRSGDSFLALPRLKDIHEGKLRVSQLAGT